MATLEALGMVIGDPNSLEAGAIVLAALLGPLCMLGGFAPARQRYGRTWQRSNSGWAYSTMPLIPMP